MVRPVQSPDILDIVPEHVADPVRRAPWRKRLLTWCGDGFLSLALNGAVVGWLMGVGWPLRDLKAPQAISVELVDHVPGAQAATPPKGASQSPGGGEAPSSVASATPEHYETAPAKPDAPTPPTPSEPPKAEPEPKADTASSTPMAAPSDTPPAAEPSGSAPPNPEPATPPPPEHPDNNAAPHLVEAPSAPPPEPVHSEPKHEPAGTEPTTALPETAEEPPQALSPPDSPDAVPPPAPVEEAPKPLTAEQKRQAENTAKLAAMLPFGANIGADPLQSASTSQGGGTSTAYRGAVYANFNKAQDVIADAKAKHLKGQAVIAFSIDDHGGIATIGVAVSSGNPAVDQAALEMIRRAAPFPPPPPGAQRSFAPAIGLGLDE